MALRIETGRSSSEKVVRDRAKWIQALGRDRELIATSTILAIGAGLCCFLRRWLAATFDGSSELLDSRIDCRDVFFFGAV